MDDNIPKTKMAKRWQQIREDFFDCLSKERMERESENQDKENRKEGKSLQDADSDHR